MNQILLAIVFLVLVVACNRSCTEFQDSCPINKSAKLYLFKPKVYSSGGVFVFNDSIFLDMRKISISKEKDNRLNKIYKQRVIVNKNRGTNTIQLIFSSDTIIIYENERVGEPVLFTICEQ